MDSYISKSFVMRTTAGTGVYGTVCDFVAAKTGLSKAKTKDAMNKGALWIRKKGPLRRLRRATARIHAGDYLELHYDEALLAIKPPVAECLGDRGPYSVWHKPAGLLAQGTLHGDHCSLARQAELFFSSSREVFLVHRLDREASGLMLIAHCREAAARLSELFRKNLIAKGYRAEVSGNLAERGERGLIDLSLEGKPSVTEFELMSYDSRAKTSTVKVSIRTGRLHQIRRHFEMIGFPVMGDPRYGKGNKNKEGLKLSAVSLRFLCPFQGKEVEFTLPEVTAPDLATNDQE